MVKYTYDAWGNHTVEDSTDCGLGTRNPFRYRGYYYDTETGLYYLQTRYYDPEIGRFVTIDDVAYLAPDTIGGLNLYSYCNNNPVMCVDPWGTSVWRWIRGRWKTRVVQPIKAVLKNPIKEVFITPKMAFKAFEENLLIIDSLVTHENSNVPGRNKAVDIVNELVLNQVSPDVEKMRIGDHSMSFAGCEIIAVYNAMFLLGYNDDSKL